MLLGTRGSMRSWPSGQIRIDIDDPGDSAQVKAPLEPSSHTAEVSWRLNYSCLSCPLTLAPSRSNASLSLVSSTLFNSSCTRLGILQRFNPKPLPLFSRRTQSYSP
jgi:hypothetical protein